MIPASVRIFVCTRPYDMRCSYDTLALAAQQVIGEDPQSGALFVFSNKRSNRLKILSLEHEQLQAEREQYRKLYLEMLERCALLERGIVAGKKAERYTGEGSQLTLQRRRDPAREVCGEAPPVIRDLHGIGRIHLVVRQARRPDQ